MAEKKTATSSRATKPRKRKLTPKQVRFVKEYLIDLNATGAARRAGYAQDDPDDVQSAALDLPMSRGDIADYLGLTIETVSRTFTTLKEEGLIDLPSAQHVVLPDLEVVEAAASAD